MPASGTGVDAEVRQWEHVVFVNPEGTKTHKYQSKFGVIPNADPRLCPIWWMFVTDFLKHTVLRVQSPLDVETPLEVPAFTTTTITAAGATKNVNLTAVLVAFYKAAGCGECVENVKMHLARYIAEQQAWQLADSNRNRMMTHKDKTMISVYGQKVDPGALTAMAGFELNSAAQNSWTLAGKVILAADAMVLKFKPLLTQIWYTAIGRDVKGDELKKLVAITSRKPGWMKRTYVEMQMWVAVEILCMAPHLEQLYPKHVLWGHPSSAFQVQRVLFEEWKEMVLPAIEKKRAEHIAWAAQDVHMRGLCGVITNLQGQVQLLQAQNAVQTAVAAQQHEELLRVLQDGRGGGGKDGRGGGNAHAASSPTSPTAQPGGGGAAGGGAAPATGGGGAAAPWDLTTIRSTKLGVAIELITGKSKIIKKVTHKPWNDLVPPVPGNFKSLGSRVGNTGNQTRSFVQEWFYELPGVSGVNTYPSWDNLEMETKWRFKCHTKLKTAMSKLKRYAILIKAIVLDTANAHKSWEDAATFVDATFALQKESGTTDLYVHAGAQLEQVDAAVLAQVKALYKAK